MLLDKPTVDIFAPMQPAEAISVIRTGKWSDDEALKRVVQDTVKAENFEAQKQWVMQWPMANALYQSPFTPRYWEGTQTERASIPFYTVALAVNSMVPQILNGLFYQNPPFMVEERPGTTAQAARAIGAILGYQLEDINFREELRLGVLNALLFGTAIWKWGWETYTRKRKVYRRTTSRHTIPSLIPGQDPVPLPESDDDIEEVVTEEYVDRPTFEHIINLRQVLVDPTLAVPDIRKAKYVVHRMYLTWNDLDKLRDRPGFNIPSKEDLIMLFFPPREEAIEAPIEEMVKNPLWDARAEARYHDGTVDPFNEPLEVLERWDNETYTCVLQQKLVIANDENEYGMIPFFSVGWWDVPEAFWSMGLAKTIGAEQRLQQGITNTWLDNASLNLNGVYVRVRGKSVPTQSIRIAPGKIVEVDNKDDFKVLDRLPAVPEAGAHIQLSQQRAEAISGATETMTQGVAGASGHSNLARTATGANMLGAGAGSRTADFVEKLTMNVFIPFLYNAHELNCRLLPVQTWRHILSEELQHDYMKESGDILALLNARLRFTILAAAKMQSRKNMAQALPILIQFLTSQETTQQLAVANKRVDVAEIMRMLFEVSDWHNYNDVVVDMSPEDAQRALQMSPAGAQMARNQNAVQMQNMKFQQQQQLSDQENISRAGREILRVAMEKAAMPEELTGEPGGTAFGSNA